MPRPSFARTEMAEDDGVPRTSRQIVDAMIERTRDQLASIERVREILTANGLRAPR